MTGKNTAEGNSIQEEKFLSLMEEEVYREKIQDWWFDDTLYHEKNSGQTEVELKKFYAFIQVFYHDNFRKCSTEIDPCFKELIRKVESEKKYTDGTEKQFGK